MDESKRSVDTVTIGTNSADIGTGMQVVKRDGSKEPVSFDQILNRIKTFCYGLHADVDPVSVAQTVIASLVDGVPTSVLDDTAASLAADMATIHPHYAKLAGRLAAGNLQKQTSDSFLEVVRLLHAHKNAAGAHTPLVSDELLEVAVAHDERITSAINYARDLDFSYFGFKTLERAYLLRIDGTIVERPQHLLMRVSLGIHGDDIDRAIETYELMSTFAFIHATPTLFNSGTRRPQMSSCFLLPIKDDSIDGIYDTLHNCATISKYAGGVGLSIHNVRASGAPIHGTNGVSNGIMPMLNVFNATARYVDQGGGKRKGSFAVYIEPWHANIEEFLDMKTNTTRAGGSDVKSRDLFPALWVPDMFMRRVKANGDWSLFCPSSAPGLHDVHGAEFDALYERYESEGRAVRVVRAQSLWDRIIASQAETGTPYMVYKDACNIKSNQKNLGTITCSNLCTEIVQKSSPDEVAVCNLASVSLPYFVDTAAQTFNFERLVDVVRVMTRNLDTVIDKNFYSLKEAKTSNMRHRPMGIGVQGLADVFVMLKMPYEGKRAAALNRDIFETIYYAAITESIRLAEASGPYESFPGSPASKGLFQFDLWGDKPTDRYDWKPVRERMVKIGLRNSLLTAVMPTASTSQIMGNNEGIEAFTSNVYKRRVLSGDFICVNRHMVNDFVSRGMWTPALRHAIISNGGSIRGIPGVPADMQELYKTVWEIKQKAVIEMSRARSPYICQSQSLNIHIARPTKATLTSMHFAGWSRGLKTGMYYLRSRPVVDGTAAATDAPAGSSTEKATLATAARALPVTEESDCLMCSA